VEGMDYVFIKKHFERVDIELQMIYDKLKEMEKRDLKKTLKRL